MPRRIHFPPFLNKWALGYDSTAATSDITQALIRAVGRTAPWACSSLYVYSCADLSIFACVLTWKHAAPHVSQGRTWSSRGEEACANWILTLSELRVWDDGRSLTASKNAYSAHPAAGLPGNAGYGHLIEFPKRSLYRLSNHPLIYNCLCAFVPPYFY